MKLSTTILPAFVSLLALMGVALHDTKVDKLATSLVGIPALMATTDAGSKLIQNDPHTHVERVVLNEMNTTNPRLAPRFADQKKHMLQRGTPKGTHCFDSVTQFV